MTAAGADLGVLGTLVGEGRTWAKVRLTPLAAGEDPTPLLMEAEQATSMTVRPLISHLEGSEAVV